MIKNKLNGKKLDDINNFLENEEEKEKTKSSNSNNNEYDSLYEFESFKEDEKNKNKEKQDDWTYFSNRKNLVNIITKNSVFVSGGTLNSSNVHNKKYLIPKNRTYNIQKDNCNIDENIKDNFDNNCSNTINKNIMNNANNSVNVIEKEIKEERKANHLYFNFENKNRIEVIKNDEIIQTYVFDQNKKKLTFGRIETADVRTEHLSCSRLHACIEAKDDSCKNNIYILKDFNSMHGTFLNGGKIAAEKFYVLEDGDEINFGLSTRVYTFRKANENCEEQVEKKRKKN